MQLPAIIKGYYKFASWVLIIGLLCLAPADEFKRVHITIPYFDKVVHFGLFFVLGLLISAIKNYNYSKVSHVWLPLFSALYGGLIELAQSYFTSTRTGDSIDWFADLLGLALGIFIFRYLPIKLKWVLT